MKGNPGLTDEQGTNLSITRVGDKICVSMLNKENHTYNQLIGSYPITQLKDMIMRLENDPLEAKHAKKEATTC
jgi:hypothetical protein